MKRRYVTGIVSLLVALLPLHRALAQVVPDATLLDESTQLQRQGNRIIVEGGASRGAALFHSFEQFSIADDQQVFFTSPQNVDAILSRVTGAAPSNLEGTLGVLGAADLFLLNPNGILFGPNAQLDLSGSFTASTADGLRVGDLEFSAINPESVPLLSISVLPGLQFGANSSERLIQNQAVLMLAPQQQLSFDGGTVEQAGQIIIPGGTVDLQGRSLNLTGTINTRDANNQPGRVRLRSPENLTIEATGSLTNSAINQTLQNNEVVVESDRTLTLIGPLSSNSTAPLTFSAGDDLNLLDDGTGAVSTVSANVALQSDGNIRITSPLFVSVTEKIPQLTIQAIGDIIIEADRIPPPPNFALIVLTGNGGILSIEGNRLTLANSGTVLTFANGGGVGPEIDILVNRDVVLDRAALGTRAINGETAGDIHIRAGASVQLLPNSTINSVPSTGESASTGSIAIQAGDTILLQSGLVATQAAGSAGDIDFSAQKIILDGTMGQSLIAADTQILSIGDAGDITLEATESVELIGNNPGPSSFSDPEQLGLASFIDLNFGETTVQATSFGFGPSGKIEVNTDRLSLRDGALLVNATGLFGNVGEAGDIVVNANDIELRGFASIATGAVGDEDAGRLEINSDRIRLDDGANIGVSSAFGAGNAGELIVRTDDLVVAGGSVLSANSQGGGGSGQLDIQAQSIIVNGTSEDGRFPSSFLTDVSPTSTGSGGPLNIQTGTLDVLNGGQIRASTRGAENAGTIDISAEEITIKGRSANGSPSAIEAQSTDTGAAGDITLSANQLTIQEQATLSTQSLQGSGGNITLSIDELLLLREQGAISATAGILETEGDGGNINIDAGFVVAPAVENSDITANAFLGTGGNVTIGTTALLGITFRDQLTAQSDITASSEAGLDGVVVIEEIADDVEPEQIKLPDNLVSAEDQLTAGCLLDEDASFVATGRGGIPAGPGERLNQALIWSDPRTVTTDSALSSTVPVTPVSMDLTEAQGWRTNKQGQIELIAASNHSAPRLSHDCQ